MRVIITVTRESAGTLVRVDGWLGADSTAELARVLHAATAPWRLVVHDLRGADAAGLSLLRRLADEGTPLEGLSPYIRLMLAAQASSESPSEHHVARSETPVRREDA